MSFTHMGSFVTIFAFSLLFSGNAFGTSVGAFNQIEFDNSTETDINIALGYIDTQNSQRVFSSTHGWEKIVPSDDETESYSYVTIPWDNERNRTWFYGEQFVDNVLMRYWQSENPIGESCIATQFDHYTRYIYTYGFDSIFEELLPRKWGCLQNGDGTEPDLDYQYFSGMPVASLPSSERTTCLPSRDVIIGQTCPNPAKYLRYYYEFKINHQDCVETLSFENDEQVSGGGEEIDITYYIKELGDKENLSDASKYYWNSYTLKVAPGEIKRPGNHGQVGRFWSRSTPVVGEIYISAKSENHRYGDEIYCISKDRTAIRKPTDLCNEKETPIRAYKKKMERGGKSNKFVFTHQSGTGTSAKNEDELMRQRKLSPEKRVVLNFSNNTGEEVNVFYYIQPKEYDYRGKTLARGWFTIGKHSASRKLVAVFDKLSAYHGDIYIYARGKTMRWGSEYNSLFHCAPVNSPFQNYEQEVFDPSCPNYNLELASEMMPVGTFMIENAKPAYAGTNETAFNKDREYSITFKKEYAEVADSERKEIPTLFDTRVELCNKTAEPLRGSILFPEKDSSWTSVNMELPAVQGGGEQCVLYEEPILSLPDDPYAGYIAVYAEGLKSGRTWTGNSPDFCISATHLGEIEHAPSPLGCGKKKMARGRLRWVHNGHEGGIQRIEFGYDSVNDSEEPDATLLVVCNNSTETLEYAFGFETEENKERLVKGWVTIEAGTCITVDVPIGDEDYPGNVLVYAKDQHGNEFNRTEKAACVKNGESFQERIRLAEDKTCPSGWTRVYMEEKKAKIGESSTVDLGVIPDPEIFVCNEHDEPLYVAYALFSKDVNKWQSYSWFKVEPPSSQHESTQTSCKYNELKGKANCRSMTMHLGNQGLYHGSLFLYAETDFYKQNGGKKEMCVDPLRTTEGKVFLDAEGDCKKTVQMEYFAPFSHGEKRQYLFRKDQNKPVTFSSDDCNDACQDKPHYRPAYRADGEPQCICELGYRDYGNGQCQEKAPCRISTLTKVSGEEQETVERRFYDKSRNLLFRATGAKGTDGATVWNEVVYHVYGNGEDDSEAITADSSENMDPDVDTGDGGQNGVIEQIRSSEDIQTRRVIRYNRAGKPIRETETIDGSNEYIKEYHYDEMDTLWKVEVDFYADNWCDEITLFENQGGVPVAVYKGDDYSCEDIKEVFSSSDFSGTKLRQFIRTGYFQEIRYYTYDSAGHLEIEEIQTNGHGLTDRVVKYTYDEDTGNILRKELTVVSSQLLESKIEYHYDSESHKNTLIEYYDAGDEKPDRWTVHKYDSYGYPIETLHLNDNRFAIKWENRDFDCWQ